MRIGITGDVQPVTPPVFAITWRIQITIHDPSFRFRRGIIQKGLNLFPGRRQTGQIKTHPAQPLHPVHRRGEFQPMNTQPGDQETIDV